MGQRKLPKCFHNSQTKIKNQIYFHFQAKRVCSHTFHEIKDVCFCAAIAYFVPKKKENENLAKTQLDYSERKSGIFLFVRFFCDLKF